MSRYAAIVAIAFIVRGLTGSAGPVGYAGGALLLTGVILDGGYRIAVRRSERSIPTARVPLDWIVRVQWIGAGLAGIAAAVAVDRLGVGTHPLADDGLFLDAVVTAVTIGIVAIFVSSLIDWYWILPRISGVVRKAPCEEAGGQQWARTTGVWLFHRGVATTAVAGCLYGVFLYMGSQDQSSARGSWYIAATIVATATLAFLAAASRALWLGLNPRVQLGDRLDVHGRPCHVIDVSLQGAKYVELDELGGRRRTRAVEEAIASRAAESDDADDHARPRPERGCPDGSGFVQKEDGSISLEDFGRFRRDGFATPCADGCKQVNWYCRCNPRAYD
jgi:hypothetical protein